MAQRCRHESTGGKSLPCAGAAGQGDRAKAPIHDRAFAVWHCSVPDVRSAFPIASKASSYVAKLAKCSLAHRYFVENLAARFGVSEIKFIVLYIVLYIATVAQAGSFR